MFDWQVKVLAQRALDDEDRERLKARVAERYGMTTRVNDEKWSVSPMQHGMKGGRPVIDQQQFHELLGELRRSSDMMARTSDAILRTNYGLEHLLHAVVTLTAKQTEMSNRLTADMRIAELRAVKWEEHARRLQDELDKASSHGG